MAGGYFGMYHGSVVNNADPEARGRLIVVVPAVTGFRQTHWAEAAHPNGFPIIAPLPGDPVWVAFEGGNTERPIWIGSAKVSSAGGSVVSFDALNVTGDLAVGGDLALTGTLTSGTVPWARLSDVPTDLVTTDTAQTITAQKVFTAATNFSAAVAVIGQITTQANFAATSTTPQITFNDTTPGQSTPSKSIRSSAGQLQFVNSAYDNVVATLSDGGTFNTIGYLTEAGQRVYSPNNPQPVTPPSVTGAMMLMGA